MKDKKQILTVVITVFVTLVIAFGLPFGIKQIGNAITEAQYLARVEWGYGETKNSANQLAEDVTMIELIANPEKYHGRLVRVIGVGNLEFEGNCIALSLDDLQNFTGNVIWIELGNRAISYEDAKQYNGEYVIVEGFFDQYDCGHMDMFCGSIKDVSRYQLWK